MIIILSKTTVKGFPVTFNERNLKSIYFRQNHAILISFLERLLSPPISPIAFSKEHEFAPIIER